MRPRIILFALSVSFFACTSNGLTLHTPRLFINGLLSAYQLYFWGTNLNQWQSRFIGNPVHAQICLGYDPQIEYIYEPHALQQTTTLYLHGWGDTKNSARLLKKFCNVITDNMVIFNFADARPVIGKLSQSSFGQLNDILSALYAAHCAVKELHLDALHLFGISRGAATIINMLALLNDDDLFQQYEKELLHIGIDQTTRTEILQVIQQGTIILDIPLRSMKHTLAPNYLIKKLTAHDDAVWQPLETIKLLRNLKLKILIHFQHSDAVVSNNQEAEFFYELAKNNPKTTFLVMGNDGGHLHTHVALSKTVNNFKTMMNSEQQIDETFFQVITGTNDCCTNAILINFKNPTLLSINNALKNYHHAQPNFFKRYFSKIAQIRAA